ncbi:MAG: glycoside hydrolase family 32 protein [Gordonia sp. (in: high G+C Gram-positive bacteria)]|uniref:glycoside hydrolase family 32 protein n=1 Tax=Gordonia sp. (in: high G+C Gram-positive bacteria) TaxID=84139 RepID=UPI0039E44EF8
MTSLHYAPSRNWVNDPNGLLFHEGRYHLFFQYNPLGIEHANMSWGHASSPDLLTWEEHPVAIAFDDDEQVFSGSAVVDHAGTTGLGSPERPALVAFYTSMSTTADRQAQSIAYSLDDGLHWTKYAGNPVLDRRSPHFRDPKVFRWTGEAESYWVMAAVEAPDRQVVFYRSDDLLAWEFLSAFGPRGAVGGEWECPDLFPLRVDGAGTPRWVLLVSLNPGGVAGGSGTQYFLGDFDGRVFTPDDDAVRWLDHGRDCYAGVSFAGLADDDRVLIAWMNNWDYARTMPVDPAAPQRGRMTLARRLALTTLDGEVRLRQEPVTPPVVPAAALTGRPVPAGEHLEVALPPAGRIALSAAPGDAPGFTVELRDDAGRRLVLAYDAGEWSLDRSDCAAGLPPGFGDLMRMPVAAASTVAAVLWYDAHGIEVYADDGTRVLTALTGELAVSTLRLTGGGHPIHVTALDVGSVS